MLNQDLLLFRLTGYRPNDNNFLFEDGEVKSNDRSVAVRELNKLGVKVLQIGIKTTKHHDYDTCEWWLVEEE